ncbi:hypothetical protein [Marinobacter salsuginis]|uniref:hypothetical protein n=1 Tax=Marinobacter salsuginis TaxID=418719 RepID=UPI00273F4929|nr:hypothetical protein [Marinobacter salsuginis]
MRKLMLCLLVVLPSISLAEQPSCEDVSDLARDVMRNRQANIPMAEMMKATEGMPMVQSIIKEAYKIPRYGSEEFKRDAMTDFSNNWYMACLESGE